MLVTHAASSIDDDAVAGAVDELRSAAMARQQRPPFRSYKTILRASLDDVLAQRGLAPRGADGDLLLSHLRAIPAHPEVPAVLAGLRTRFRLAIVSNSDDDLIAGTVAAMGVPIDQVVTAEQARAYKPDHGLFHHAHAVIGATSAETVHVGMGQITDLKVCHELGIRAVFIDRLGEALNPDWAPAAVLSNLAGLPSLLGLADQPSRTNNRG